MEIVGTGMLAKAFNASGANQQNLLIFCSGVSNSKETLNSQFVREKEALLSVVSRNPLSKIVYFSSCAVESVDSIESPYLRHKLEMEFLVKNTAKHYLIVRLPEVVGITYNQTLVSYFVKCINNMAPITLLQGAKRNLIDVSDVVRLTLLVADSDIQTINITNGIMTPVDEIIKNISMIMNMSPLIVPGQNEIEPRFYDGSILKRYIGRQDCIYSKEYSSNVLSKYVPKLISLLKESQSV